MELAKLFLTRARARFIDEPTTFLDKEARYRVIDLLERLSDEGLMVIATHDRELLEKLKPVMIIMDAGRIIKIVTYDEASDILKARRVYLVKARVRTADVRSLERIRRAKGVRRASYSVDIESLLEILGLSELKESATLVSIIDPDEARKLADAVGMRIYTLSGIEVEANIEAEVYAESLAEFIDFLAERFVINKLSVSSIGKVAEV